MHRLAQRRVASFLALLVVFTVAAHFLAAHFGHRSIVSSLAIMWSPALAALAAGLLTRRPLREIGWRPWPLKWLAAGWALPLLYAVPAYGLVWALGLGGVPSPTFLERARLTLGMTTGSDAYVIASAFFYISVVNLLPAMLLSLGEEIGWRGYLVPELAKWGGFRRAALLSGAIWGIWHLPGVLGGSYGNAETPLVFRLACFAALVVGTGVFLAWLRLKSGSVWPAAIFHAAHNGMIQAFFNRITADTGPTPYFIGEFGVAMVPFVLLIAWFCWRRGVEPDKGSARAFAESAPAEPRTPQPSPAGA